MSFYVALVRSDRSLAQLAQCDPIPYLSLEDARGRMLVERFRNLEIQALPSRALLRSLPHVDSLIQLIWLELDHAAKEWKTLPHRGLEAKAHFVVVLGKEIYRPITRQAEGTEHPPSKAMKYTSTQSSNKNWKYNQRRLNRFQCDLY